MDSQSTVFLTPDVYANIPSASRVYLNASIYATDKDAVYRCMQTGASTYAWKAIWYNRQMPQGSSCLIQWKFEDGYGATTYADSGSVGATLTPATAGTGCASYAEPAGGPWGQGCARLRQASTGKAYITSASGLAEQAYPITWAGWIKVQEYVGGETQGRIMFKKWNNAYTAPKDVYVLNLNGATGDYCPCSITTGANGSGTIKSYTGAIVGPFKYTWAHIGFTYDGTNLRGYMNGMPGPDTAVTGAIDYNTAGGAGRIFQFGADPASNVDRVDMHLADWRLYSVKQTDAWFLETYQRGIGVWQG